jgi:uncharacterized protein YbjQ (UPF0145 family)
MLTPTTFELPGVPIVGCLGLLRGLPVRIRSLPVTRVGGLRALFGCKAGIFTNLCEGWARGVVSLMVSHARELGANAAVGMRQDTGTLLVAAELLCYGTAVVTEALDGRA